MWVMDRAEESRTAEDAVLWYVVHAAVCSSVHLHVHLYVHLYVALYVQLFG